MEDCLTNVIKLSRTECECFDDDKPTDYNEGQSEVYLDELEGLSLRMLGGAEDCEQGGIWDLMSWAREEATKAFKADLLSCINTNYISRRSAYSGVIGQSKFTTSLNLSESKIGVKTSFSQIVGGTMKINRIGVAINQTADVLLEVYDNDEYSSSPRASYTISAAANVLTWATLATPLELPMWSNNVSRLEYYFVYTRASGMLPKDCKLDCGCGGTPPGWKQWVSPYGVQGNTSDLTMFTTSNKANGILLDVDFRCTTSRIICSDDRPFDFDNEGWDMQIAYAIRWKAGALLLQKMLDSPELNRYTMMEREKTYGMRNHAIKMYNDFIAYLCDNKEISSGCLKCKNNPNFHMSNILG